MAEYAVKIKTYGSGRKTYSPMKKTSKIFGWSVMTIIEPHFHARYRRVKAVKSTMSEAEMIIDQDINKHKDKTLVSTTIEYK